MKKNNILELKLGYSLFAACNMFFSLYLLHGVVSKLFPTKAIMISVIFAIVFIPIVFVLSAFDYLFDFNVIICGVDLENIDDMSYGEKTLHLSFSIFNFCIKITGIISAVLTFLITLVFSFVIWLTSGSWYEDGLIESLYKLKNSYDNTKFAVRIYNFVTSISEMIFVKVIEWEKKIYVHIVKHRNSESEEKNTPLIEKQLVSEDTTYMDNIDMAQKGNPKAQVMIGKYLITYGNEKKDCNG